MGVFISITLSQVIFATNKETNNENNDRGRSIILTSDHDFDKFVNLSKISDNFSKYQHLNSPSQAFDSLFSHSLHSFSADFSSYQSQSSHLSFANSLVSGLVAFPFVNIIIQLIGKNHLNWMIPLTGLISSAVAMNYLSKSSPFLQAAHTNYDNYLDNLSTNSSSNPTKLTNNQLPADKNPNIPLKISLLPKDHPSRNFSPPPKDSPKLIASLDNPSDQKTTTSKSDNDQNTNLLLLEVLSIDQKNHANSMVKQLLTPQVIDQIAKRFYIDKADQIYIPQLTGNFINQALHTKLDRYIFLSQFVGYQYPKDFSALERFDITKKHLQFKIYQQKIKWNLLLSKHFRSFNDLDSLYNYQTDILDHLDYINSYQDLKLDHGWVNSMFPRDPYLIKSLVSFFNNHVDHQIHKGMFLTIVFSLPKMTLENKEKIFNAEITDILHITNQLIDNFSELYPQAFSQELLKYQNIYQNFLYDLPTDQTSSDGSSSLNDQRYADYQFSHQDHSSVDLSSMVEKLDVQLKKLPLIHYTVIGHRFKTRYQNTNFFRTFALNYFSMLEQDLDKIIFAYLVLDFENFNFIADNHNNYHFYYHSINDISKHTSADHSLIWESFLDIKRDFSSYISGNNTEKLNITWEKSQKPYQSSAQLLKACLELLPQIQFDHYLLQDLTNEPVILNYFRDEQEISNLIYHFTMKILKNNTMRLIFLNQMLKILYFDQKTLARMLPNHPTLFYIRNIESNLIDKFQLYMIERVYDKKRAPLKNF